MNCEGFELIINDLARGQIMYAAAREEGLAHIEACARCATRLADECALTANLRAFAASVEHAPAHTEAALRVMFREHAEVSSLASGSVTLTSANARRHWTRWALTAAAAVLALVMLTTLHWQRWSVAPEQGKRETYVPQLIPTIDIATSGEQAPSNETSTLEGIADKQRGMPQSFIRRVPEEALHVVSRPKRSGRLNVGPRDVHKTSSDLEMEEVTTDFLPLVDGSNLDPLESGQVVRVKLPRSALMSFGLPMNMERAHEPVKADVLLGEDGVARAVRFVKND